MNLISFPDESDLRKWVKEAVKDSLHEYFKQNKSLSENEEIFLSRKEIAGILRVSLVTLTDWMKRGLPCHKNRGRVYFIRSEVMEHIKKQHLRPHGMITRLSENRQ